MNNAHMDCHNDRPHFTCPTCGGTHEGDPTDIGYQLPDVIWALGADARAPHLEWSSNLAHLHGRWFLWGVLAVPLRGRGGTSFGWGVWAEVQEGVIARYMKVWSQDGSDLASESGSLANKLPTYDDTTGLPVQVQFGRPEHRPSIRLADRCHHPLAGEQREGLTPERYHELLDHIRP